MNDTVGVTVTTREVRWVPDGPRPGTGEGRPAKPMSARARWEHILEQLNQFGNAQESSTSTLTAGKPGSKGGK